MGSTEVCQESHGNSVKEKPEVPLLACSRRKFLDSLRDSLTLQLSPAAPSAAILTGSRVFIGNACLEGH